MTDAFSDYFRGGEPVGGTDVEGSRSSSSGFFVYDHTICYGRAQGVVPSRTPEGAPDVSVPESARDGGLPFDLDEIVGNLRCERYREPLARELAEDRGVAASAWARRLYYALRPILPLPVRKRVQQARHRGWEQLTFPKWPVDCSVDELMRSVLARELRRRRQRTVPFIWFWPDGAQAAATVTHDVEDKPGREGCGALMDLDDEFGVPSSFQVIPEGRYDDSATLVDEIRARGFEVNVHDLNHDGWLFHEREEFLRRARRINEYAERFGSRGFRSAVMYRRQEWLDALDVDYDMSVPNVAHLDPQRGGCCTVTPYFVGRILEIPLTTIQDYALFHILGDYSASLWLEQARLIRRVHGLISVDVHPDYLIANRARAVYRVLLEYLSGERDHGELWVASPGEVNRWWRDRREMRLVARGDQWSVEGPSSERARVAYAVLDEQGRCDYRFPPAPERAATPGEDA